MIAGSMVALVTPMDAQGGLDWGSLSSLVDFHLQEGTNAIVAVGTTGESATLDVSEHIEVIRRVVDQVAGRIPVIAGTGGNSTRESVELTRAATEVGADACLLVTPYYNKPTQEGLYQHFKAVHDSAEIPMIIYNIPGRSIVDMTVETMARLAELPRVTGVKDATSDPVRPIKTRMAIGADFTQLSGEDASIVPFLAHGGHGCISVTANVAPKPLSELHEAWQRRDLDTVFSINERLQPLHAALFCETSPGPVKYAAKLLGLCDGTARLPMVEIADTSKRRVEDAMRHAGLLN